MEKHYLALLELTEGWTVRKVELELAQQRVEIDVEWTGPRVVCTWFLGCSALPKIGR